MTPCVAGNRRPAAARPNVTILVIVVVIMLVATENGWSLADVTGLVAAAAMASGLPRRAPGAALCRAWRRPVPRTVS
jgi:hypothetical protein